MTTSEVYEAVRKLGIERDQYRLALSDTGAAHNKAIAERDSARLLLKDEKARAEQATAAVESLRRRAETAEARAEADCKALAERKRLERCCGACDCAMARRERDRALAERDAALTRAEAAEKLLAAVCRPGLGQPIFAGKLCGSCGFPPEGCLCPRVVISW